MVKHNKKVSACFVFTDRLGKVNIRLNLHGINLPEFASDHVHDLYPLRERATMLHDDAALLDCQSPRGQLLRPLSG